MGAVPGGKYPGGKHPDADLVRIAQGAGDVDCRRKVRKVYAGNFARNRRIPGQVNGSAIYDNPVSFRVADRAAAHREAAAGIDLDTGHRAAAHREAAAGIDVDLGHRAAAHREAASIHINECGVDRAAKHREAAIHSNVCGVDRAAKHREAAFAFADHGVTAERSASDAVPERQGSIDN